MLFRSIVSLEPGESIEFKCTDPKPHLFPKRFKAAVEAAGGVFGQVWFRSVDELSPQE